MFVNLQKLNETLKLFGDTITLWTENVILIWLINLIDALKTLIPIEFQVTAESSVIQILRLEQYSWDHIAMTDSNRAH